MIDKFEIKIIRFKTGEDIVGFVLETDSTIEIKYPKVFYFSIDTEEYDSELIMMDWMTNLAFAFQYATFNKSEVLFVTYPNLEFGYNYLSAVLEDLEPKDLEPESKFYGQIKNLLNEQNDFINEELDKIIVPDTFPKIIH